MRRSPYGDAYGEGGGRRQRRARQARAEQRERKRTPLLLRLLSWLGVILLCFVAGYLGTSWLMDALNKRSLLKPQDRIETQEDLKAMEEAERGRAASGGAGEGVQQVSLQLYYAKDGTVVGTRRSFVARAQEDEIAEALRAVLSLSNVPDADDIELLHVFRNADTVFLDFSSRFVTALSSMGQRQGLLLLTGIVRTMQENFSPIVQVRFLIDSKTPDVGGPVDLTVPWRMPDAQKGASRS